MLIASLMRCCFATVAIAALTLPATAQLVQNLAFANGTHIHGAPYWTDNVPDPNAEAGVVPQLNFTPYPTPNLSWLELDSPQLALLPGTYVTQAKVAKTISTAGIADLTVAVRSGSTVLGSTTLPAANQTLNTYVWSPEVIFTVHQPTTVKVSVLSTLATVSKYNYRFDTARIGRVPFDRVVQVDSLDTWSYAHSTFYDRYVAQPGSVYGRVAKRNNQPLAWLEVYKQWNLAAGTHVANVRLRNIFGPAPGQAQDLSFDMLDSITLNTLASVTIPAASQQAGAWVQSPNLVVTRPTAGPVYFVIRNYGMTGSLGYEFDSFTLRSSSPSFSPYGASCHGLTLAQTFGGQLGTTMTLALGNGGSALFGIFVFGNPVSPTPLDFLGATGCLLHVTPTVLLSEVFVAGGCITSIVVPNQPSLFGITLNMQGAAYDQTVPGSLKTANAGQSYIGL
jgi:hypothetical protein